MAENDKRMTWAVTAVLAVVALVLIAILAVVFLPLKSISSDITQGTGGQYGTDTVVVNIYMNMGNLEVRFAPLNGPAVVMHTTMKARVGMMDQSDAMQTWLNSEALGNICMVTALANVRENLLFNSDMQVNNVIEVDPRFNTSVNISLNTGSVTFDTTEAKVVENITIGVNTGSISMHLADNTKIKGDLDTHTEVGSLRVNCGNITFVGPARHIATSSRTGSVEVTCNLTNRLTDQVEWDISTVTGSVELDLTISDELAAELVANSNVGSVSVPTHQNFQVIQQKDGFAKYQSMNYATEYGIDFQVDSTNVGSVEAHLVQT